MTTISAPTGYALAPGEGEHRWIVADDLWIKASAATTGGSLTLLEVVAAPGGGPPPHVHTYEDETFYVLEGDFQVFIGDEIRTGGPGTVTFVPRGTVHRFAALNGRPGRILIVFTPGGMDGFFREAGRRATDDGPAPPLDADEIARTSVAAERYGMRIVTWES